MKKIGMIAVLLTVTTLSAQASTLARCFNASKGKIGRITMTDTSVRIDYDLADVGRNTKESGNFLRNIKKTSSEVSAVAFLMGTGDGGDVKFTIRNDNVSFQGLWQNGHPIEKPVKFAVVPCP